MAVAISGSKSSRSLTQPFNCFKVSSLSETILDANQTARLKDRYILGRQLGWGQFGIIRVCTDRCTGDVLACKSIAKDRLVTQEDVRSVKLEIEIMTRLSGHPNVVDLKAVYEEEDYVHLVMELCAGGELFDQLEKNGRYTESEAKVLFRHLMRVIMYCHDHGVVHRDLKPENILLATNASSSPIKLADFGLATYIRPGESLHGTVGSPFYIAPEVLGGGYTQSADVWSAGVILYILLSGNPPFWGKTKSRIFDAVRAADLRFPSEPWGCLSESAKELIKKMLCVDPSQRLTAQQVLDHSWMMEEQSLDFQESHGFQTLCNGHWDSKGGSVSVTFMPRDQDISFGTKTHPLGDPQSPTLLTCRSSFSAFFVEPSSPSCLISAGFSFGANEESTSEESKTPISSMPSFAFFTPSSETGNQSVDQSVNVARDAAIHAVAGFGKLFMSPDSSNESADMKQKTAEAKRTGGFGSRMSGIHNKRNRTIGLGEVDQLDIMVTESVIRWASCTHLPSAASLTSSLVC